MTVTVGMAFRPLLSFSDNPDFWFLFDKRQSFEMIRVDGKLRSQGTLSVGSGRLGHCVQIPDLTLSGHQTLGEWFPCAGTQFPVGEISPGLW